jgi:hypothetical protein
VCTERGTGRVRQSESATRTAGGDSRLAGAADARSPHISLPANRCRHVQLDSFLELLGAGSAVPRGVERGADERVVFGRVKHVL